MTERNKAAIVIVAVIVVSSIVVFGVLSGPLHFEKYRSLDDDRYLYLTIKGVEDTEIFMSFANDSALVFSMDVLFYDERSDYNIVDPESDLMWTFIFEGRGRVKQINVTFGNGVYVHPVIWGNNVSIYSVVNNGALFRGQSFDFTCTQDSYSSLNLYFTEDVNFYDQGVWVDASRFTYINLIIDLPDGMMGDLEIGEGAYSVYEMEGWAYSAASRISTNVPLVQPYLDIILRDFGHASIYLHD